jgi:hypothetical protein
MGTTSARGQPPTATADVPSCMRSPPAPNETRVLPARLAKTSGTSARATPGGRTGRGAPDVGGRQGGRGSPLRTPLRTIETRVQPPVATATPKSPPESQLSESLLSDDNPAGSQDSETAYDESQVGVAGLFTRLARDLDTRLDNMRETLQESLSETLVGVTTSVSDAIRTQTVELRTTLTGISNQTTALATTLTDLLASFSGQKATMDAQNATMADIRTSLQDIMAVNKDVAFVLACLKFDLMGPPRDNVIPPSPSLWLTRRRASPHRPLLQQRWPQTVTITWLPLMGLPPLSGTTLHRCEIHLRMSALSR